MTDYAMHGVQEYWIVDTDHNTFEQYLLVDENYILNQKIKEGDLISEIFKDFKISVKEIFEL
jgi:Uma2 family endonuclease